eukprot:13171260-Alexandrium_andersonii.AAC.1
MSASLVGSEMCIRDRPLTARGRRAVPHVLLVGLQSRSRPIAASKCPSGRTGTWLAFVNAFCCSPWAEIAMDA